MKPFLYHVAKDLIERFGNNLSDVTIVFPGKRAQLYMNTFLSHFAQGPVWAPRFTTIDELFQQFSSLTPSDNILNVCTLYRIYCQLVPNPEPLDDFYGWGEILMNDFDDIDKHMADAEKLFTNATDLARMDQIDYLSDAQIAALQQFFTNFDPKHQTEIKRRFMELWQAMPEMYRRLKEELRRQGLMYKGGLYREVVNQIKNEKLIIKNGGYCFVGFNVLDEVEEALFSALRDSGQALFYWDYDVFYAGEESDHEAGLFLRHNLKHYPNALPPELFDNLMLGEKRIRFLATSTDNAQVRYLPQWLKEKLTQPEHETAVILCDEALMRPTIHALPSPEEDEHAPHAVNITMGYPLTDTAIHGYFSSLLDLQIDGYNAELQQFRPTALERLQKNPFFSSFPQRLLPLQFQGQPLPLIDWLIEAMEAVGQAPSPLTSHLSPLYIEATFQIHRILGQFRWLVEQGTLAVRPTTLRRLMRQVLASASIPFHGEMDEGVQVMGVLEARNLDFRHLIMLSVGEGTIPRRSSDTSLIPYILRAHFGLDTTERQDSVYAYSFFRLLQRAEDITLVYNANSSGLAQREQSRFLRQLQTETDLPIEVLSDTQSTVLNLQQPEPIEKDEHIMQTLLSKSYLSPTALNQYIECPLRFYYQQVANLRMPDRPQDGIDAPRFGNIFHNACELFYRHLQEQTGRPEVQRADLAPFVQASEGLAPYVEQAFAQELQAEPGQLHFTGVNMIIRDVILQLMKQLVHWDMAHTPFTLYGMEKDVRMSLDVPSGEQTITLKIGGRIDRMDIMEVEGHPTLRVVDYKTGHAKSGPKDIAGIFDSHAANAHGYYLQTFLYAIIVSRQQQLPVSPSLFYVLSATNASTYSPVLKLGKDTVADIRDYADEYLEELRHLLAEIYDPATPFFPTEDRQKHCQYCDFRRICNNF